MSYAIAGFLALLVFLIGFTTGLRSRRMPRLLRDFRIKAWSGRTLVHDYNLEQLWLVCQHLRAKGERIGHDFDAFPNLGLTLVYTGPTISISPSLSSAEVGCPSADSAGADSDEHESSGDPKAGRA